MPDINAGDFRYYDLRRRTKSEDISLIFPGWEPSNERLAVLTPHDDDGALGAGYLIMAALANGADVFVLVFCDGWAGYSTPEEASTIVQVRARETIDAYAGLGVRPERVLRMGYADFSVLPYIGWHLDSGKLGTIANVVPTLRRLHITRLLIPNGYREHIDHEAVHRVGAYDGPQVGDAILAEYGRADPVRSFLQYAVWADLSPEDALVSGEDVHLRANRAVVGTERVEATVMDALRSWKSQGQVIEGLVDQRAGRRRPDGWLEVYYSFDPRPLLDYAPYHKLLDEIG
ncbi:MAG: PIG-L family deacetylase [Anaerolineae bacterium]|nr:PIG-L family deacetylase [Anaerolineae bacterium]